jgi:hypothetical protein
VTPELLSRVAVVVFAPLLWALLGIYGWRFVRWLKRREGTQ